MQSNYTIKKHPYGFYEVHPKPSQNDIQQHYAKKYYQSASGSYQHCYSEEELKYFDVCAETALETLTKYQIGLDRSLLDLGCGEGFFSNLFQKKKWSTTLVDFSDDGLRRHNAHLLKNFIQQDIISYTNENREKIKDFCLINLDNVLEHMINPISFLKLIKSIMGTKSILRIEVPNDFSDFQELLLNSGYTKESWVTPPEHLNYFNADNLRSTLEALDFEIISMQADFPIEQFLINEHANYNKNRKLGKAAHKTRIVVTNHLADLGLDKLVNYREAAADLKFGRLLTAYVKAA